MIAAVNERLGDIGRVNAQSGELFAGGDNAFVHADAVMRNAECVLEARENVVRV